jgi:hypothetical protein
MAGSSGSALLKARLRTAIEDTVVGSGPAWSAFVTDNLEDRAAGTGLPLAVKYVPAAYAGAYRKPNRGLFIGAGYFTWGRGVYVTGVEQPLSTAIYGRAGVVSRFDPAGWRCFDARDRVNQDLYLEWMHAQVAYRDAALTVHSNYFLRKLRNLFREQFQIDVVMFRPDEKDRPGWYTRHDDTWLVVSDWTSRRMLSGARFSSRFTDASLALMVEEEFRADRPAMTRSPLIAMRGTAPLSGGLPELVRDAYAHDWVVRVLS